MSNEVNVTELFSGTLDPGTGVELYFWGDNNSYNRQHNKARFFSVSPDPVITFPGGATLEFSPSVLNFEITRVWNTVWVSGDNPPFNQVFQSNIAVSNVGDMTGAYHIIQAETDN